MFAWIGNAVKTATTWVKKAVNTVKKVGTIASSVDSAYKKVTAPSTSASSNTGSWKVNYNKNTENLERV